MPGGGLPTTQVFTSVIFIPLRPPEPFPAPFQPVMMEAALVLPEMLSGKIEASMTRRPSRPWTLRRESTTEYAGSGPMRQVETGMIDGAGALPEILDQIVVGSD